MARSVFTATRWQILTYLLGVALFSISFLVFLNSQISFVITKRIGQTTHVGDAVGTLGFADELVALVACPVWGMLSDRVGVRVVAICGYCRREPGDAGHEHKCLSTAPHRETGFQHRWRCDVGISSLVLVRSANHMGRATMVTAILPSMTIPRVDSASQPIGERATGTNVTPSISSELTITPARYQSDESVPDETTEQVPATEASTSQLAGLVGMFTGLGALLALTVFLPLPGRFERGGATAGQAIIRSFDVVAAVALIVAVACFFGLRDLPGEEHKGWKALVGKQDEEDKGGVVANGGHTNPSEVVPSYLKLLSTSVMLGFRDVNIGLGYIGGFVARASSVGISLFIPLFVNTYFFRSGRCHADPNNPDIPSDPSNPDFKKQCAEAYILAAKLTGTSQLVALLCAPVFGYLSGRYTRYNLPLMLASLAGLAGYTAFGLLKSPNPADPDGSVGVFFLVALLGISQIGAIVCSLGLLGRGIQSDTVAATSSNGSAYPAGPQTITRGEADDLRPDARRPVNPNGTPITNRRDSLGRNAAVTSGLVHDTSPLLPSHIRRIEVDPASSRAPLKGSIAGVYSLAGGAGILLLTKVGGLLFDSAHMGSPFWMMAGFNGLLFIATLGCGVREYARHRWEAQYQVLQSEDSEIHDQRVSEDGNG